MRAVIQRVTKASVTINSQVKSSIKTGILILLGIGNTDDNSDIIWLTKKIALLRIFDDNEGIMNLSLLDIGGEAIVISQFTLHAKTKKGNRPSYINAARPEKAIPLYELFVTELEKQLGKIVKTGEFGAMMDISLTNSGPVTIIIDTKSKE
ncbi:MAG: D-tyrosyl-tRNA(Tyr) deacylase [Bacteroidetes bacterium]|nr:D-tyrosyl-tRNA(Tyr) deacylase [Bacteroidota bacterium]MBL6944169.1 D-tyrosyl-tRNA(Tyr) deacylase [Bacteroidales bacterium]